MGRYYWGDIEGKFWFAVQSSNDADNFGVEGYQPGILKYSFDEDDLPQVETKLQSICDELGSAKDELTQFFNDNRSYTLAMISEQTTIPKDNVNGMLEKYARYELGVKIRDCLKKDGKCEFEAEL
jgi:uncharacterized protein YkuJ